ncbi:unnamed protein product [Pipistrellus nathusii]|uniref:Uncharacterized protein n=1 Tax=Pipistrellus nathusii TaxID=59473 RepID=A0ABP0ADQ1_PIPNA
MVFAMYYHTRVNVPERSGPQAAVLTVCTHAPSSVCARSRVFGWSLWACFWLSAECGHSHCHHVGHFFPDWPVTERNVSDCWKTQQQKTDSSPPPRPTTQRSPARQPVFLKQSTFSPLPPAKRSRKTWAMRVTMFSLLVPMSTLQMPPFPLL